MPGSRRLDRLALFAALATAVVGLWFGLTLQPDETNRLRDDAFYEFAWAANVAAGRGPCVSDGVTTSGVQLLWSLLLVPVAALGGAAALPLVAPWLGLLLHVAAAVAWARGVRDRLVGACVALCWLGNPLLVRESQNGQETALACLLATLLWLQRRAGLGTFAVLGVLACLARSDLWLAVATLAVWRHGFTWRAAVAPLAAITVTTALNLWLGGGVLADSALPMAWLWHHNHAGLVAEGGASARWWWYLRPVLLGGPWSLASAMGIGVLVFLLARPWLPPSWRALPALGVGVASALGARDLAAPGWAALLLALQPADGARRTPRALLALTLGLGGILVLHWAVRWYPRDYYAAPLVVAATAAIVRVGRVRALLVVFALAQWTDLRRTPPEPLRGQQEMTMAGRFLGEVLPNGERVGCFNSGLVTFHADVLAGTARRGVVNLDGVVDARAFAALRAGRLGAWLDDQRIRFVVDNPVQFSHDLQLDHACGRWFAPDFAAERDLVEVARFDVPGIGHGRGGADDFRLYWRRGRGAPPERPAVAKDLGRAPRGGRYVLWPATPGAALEVEQPSGERRTLVRAEVATSWLLAVPATDLGTGRLFEAGASAPILVLAKL